MAYFQTIGNYVSDVAGEAWANLQVGTGMAFGKFFELSSRSGRGRVWLMGAMAVTMFANRLGAHLVEVEPDAVQAGLSLHDHAIDPVAYRPQVDEVPVPPPTPGPYLEPDPDDPQLVLPSDSNNESSPAVTAIPEDPSGDVPVIGDDAGRSGENSVLPPPPPSAPALPGQGQPGALAPFPNIPDPDADAHILLPHSDNAPDAPVVGLLDTPPRHDEYLWDYLERIGVPRAEIMPAIFDAVDGLQAQGGHTVEVHGAGLNLWYEIDGKSDTPSLVQVLRPHFSLR